MHVAAPLLLLFIACAAAKKAPRPEAAPAAPTEAAAEPPSPVVASEAASVGKNQLFSLVERVCARLDSAHAFFERHHQTVGVVLLASAAGVFLAKLWEAGDVGFDGAAYDGDEAAERRSRLSAEEEEEMLARGVDVKTREYETGEDGERRQRFTPEEQGLLACVVDVNSLSTTFDDVGGLEDQKKLLEELVVHPMQQAHLASNPWTGHPLLRPPTGILLYGPPGCGKTMLVRAAAKEAGVTLLQITPAFIESKWFGESAQKVSALFSLARKMQPCLIYIDEVDALCLERNVESVNRDLKSELLQQWDGLQGVKGDRIIIIGSTNALRDIDSAFQRRFARSVPVPYPTYPERIKVLEKVLAGVALDAKLRLGSVAAATDGYGSADLEELARAALNRAVREMRERMRVTAKVNAARHGESSSSDVKMDYAALRPLTLSDFEAALDDALPTKFHGADDVIPLGDYGSTGGSLGDELDDVVSSESYQPTGEDDSWMDDQIVD